MLNKKISKISSKKMLFLISFLALFLISGFTVKADIRQCDPGTKYNECVNGKTHNYITSYWSFKQLGITSCNQIGKTPTFWDNWCWANLPNQGADDPGHTSKACCSDSAKVAGCYVSDSNMSCSSNSNNNHSSQPANPSQDFKISFNSLTCDTNTFSPASNDFHLSVHVHTKLGITNYKVKGLPSGASEQPLFSCKGTSPDWDCTSNIGTSYDPRNYHLKISVWDKNGNIATAEKNVKCPPIYNGNNSASSDTSNWKCPYSNGDTMYCVVCRPKNNNGSGGCLEGEGWCNNSSQCAAGLHCVNHVCVKPSRSTREHLNVDRLAPIRIYSHPSEYDYNAINRDGSNVYLAVLERITKTIEGNYRSTEELHFYKSSDDGQTWKDMGIVNSDVGGYYDWVDIKIAGNYIYIVTSNRVFLSDNGGSSWRRVTLPNDVKGTTGRDNLDFYPLSNNKFVIAYVSKHWGVTTAVTNDGGLTWDKHIIFRGSSYNNNSISGSYPKIRAKANGNLIVTYQRVKMFYYHWRDLALYTVESKDEGKTWSAPKITMKSYNGRITANKNVKIYQPFNYHPYTSGSKTIIGYEADESLSYEYTFKTIGFYKSGVTTETRHKGSIVKPDGQLIQLDSSGHSNFAASANGQYLVFSIVGTIGNEYGIFLVYSENGGDDWHYQKLPEKWFGRGGYYNYLSHSGGKMPQLYVYNNGMVLFITVDGKEYRINAQYNPDGYTNKLVHPGDPDWCITKLQDTGIGCREGESQCNNWTQCVAGLTCSSDHVCVRNDNRNNSPHQQSSYCYKPLENKNWVYKTSYIGNSVNFSQGWFLKAKGAGIGLIYKSDDGSDIDAQILFGNNSHYGCAGKVESVWHYDFNTKKWNSFVPNEPGFTDLKTIKNGEIYSINIKEPCILKHPNKGSFWKSEYCKNGCENGICKSSAGSDNNNSGENSSFSPPCGSYGDLNQDGKIDNQDVNLLVNCINNSSNNCDNQGDLNQDNKINVQDVVILENFLSQRISTFPVCPSSCPGDFNHDRVINTLDLGIMCDNDHWGKPGITDLDNNGTTDVYDISRLITDWGKRCD